MYVFFRVFGLVQISTCDCVYLCSWIHVCWCKCAHIGLFTSPTVTQSPEPLTDAWRRARTQTCCFCVFYPHFPFHPLCCTTPTQSESQRNSALGGLGTSGNRAIFSRELHKHTMSRKNLALTGGNHGNWLWPQAQFLGIPVPGITPESCRRQRSSKDRGVGVQKGMRFFRGALWLIGRKQSNHSCQMHRMNAKKPVRMLKSAFFWKKKKKE